MSIERDQKDFRDNINKQSQEDIQAFRSEVENKIAQLFTKSNTNDDEIKYLGVRVTGVNDMVVDIEGNLKKEKENLENLKNEFAHENELTVKKITEIKTSVGTISNSLEHHFTDIAFLQENQVCVQNV